MSRLALRSSSRIATVPTTATRRPRLLLCMDKRSRRGFQGAKEMRIMSPAWLLT